MSLGIEAVTLGDRVDACQGDLRIDHSLEALERERGEADRSGHGNEPHGDAHLDAEGPAVPQEEPHGIGPEVPRKPPIADAPEPHQGAVCRHHVEAQNARRHRAVPCRAEERRVLRCGTADCCDDTGERAEERSSAAHRRKRVVERAPSAAGLGGHPAIGLIDLDHPVERAHVEDDRSRPCGSVSARVGMPAAPHADCMARIGDCGDAGDGRVHARRSHDELWRVRRRACDVVSVVGAFRRVVDEVRRADQIDEARREVAAHSSSVAAMIAPA